MPKRVSERLVEIGGRSTEYGREKFLARATRIRRAILAENPPRRYRDISDEVFESDCIPGDTTNNGPKSHKSRKWRNRDMPVKVTKANVKQRRTLAGNRGRRSIFNHHDFEMSNGDLLDVTEEMEGGISAFIESQKAKDQAVEEFTLEDIFSGENASANQYRANRFGALKRAAEKKNGPGTKYALEIATTEDEDGNERDIWALVRTS